LTLLKLRYQLGRLADVFMCDDAILLVLLLVQDIATKNECAPSSRCVHV